MKTTNTFEVINFKNEKLFAALIIFVICLIFLHPAFLGKIDASFDLRDSIMYPWAYYKVDQKTKVETLLETKIKSESKIFDSELKDYVNSLEIPKGRTQTISFSPKFSPSLLHGLKKPSLDVFYYYSFDIKEANKIRGLISVQAKLVNKDYGTYFVPKVKFLDLQENNKRDDSFWRRFYVPVDELLKECDSLDELNDYRLDIIVQNGSTQKKSVLFYKDVKLVNVDLSEVKKAHSVYNFDLIESFIPFREYYSESLKRGKFPFWNNYILCGTEFLSEPQMAYFHPLFIILYFLFEHFTAHLILNFICLFLCGIGAYLLARFWGLGILASLLIAFVYMFHPFNAVWFSYEHVLMCSATLPFLLIFYEKHLRETRFLNKYLLYSALILGLLFLSGHLQKIYYTLIFFLLFSLFRSVEAIFLKKHDLIKQFLSILFIFFIGIVIFSIIILPFLPLFEASHRVPLEMDYVKNLSVPPKAFLSLIYPFQHKDFDTHYIYFGLLPFLFSLFSFLKIFKNRLILFFTLTIFVAVLIFTGSPLFFLMREFLPGFKELQHHRFIMVYSFCVPFLSGFGLQIILDLIRNFKHKIKIVLITLLIFYSVFDLMYHTSSNFVTWSERKDYKPLPKEGALRFLKDEQKKSNELFRVLTVSTPEWGLRHGQTVAVPNTLQPYKFEDASGYSSFVPKDLYSLFLYAQTRDRGKIYAKDLGFVFWNINIPYPIQNYKSKILDLLNVKYFLVPTIFNLTSDDVEKVFSKEIFIYKNKNYMPRAFVVPACKIISSGRETIIELDSEEFNPREEVILMAIPSIILRSVSDEDVGRSFADAQDDIEFINYEPDNITLKVKTNMSGFLVLSHNLNNNWRVRINGKEGKHYQANLIQRAIYLPEAGKYTIEFYYFSKSFLIGFIITCLGFLILLLLAFYLKYRDKKEIKLNENLVKEPEKQFVNV